MTFRPSPSGRHGPPFRLSARSPLAYPPSLPAGPTEWERLLWQEGLTEAEAVRNPAVKDWVRRNGRRYYVPTRVLEKMGVVIDV